MPNTLFVVDDSATMRKVFELTFAGEDFTVVTHDGGDGAVAKIREVRPQAAIVDVNLGGATGYELVRTIRADAGVGPIPIYLLYSEHSPLDEPAARACGAVGAIVKPFETQVLIDKVKQAFSATVKAASTVTATTGNMTAPFGNPQPAPATVGAVPPPPAGGPDLSSASFTTNGFFPREISFRFSMASLASSALGISTKANPLLFPVSRSMATLAEAIVPNFSKISVSSASSRS